MKIRKLEMLAIIIAYIVRCTVSTYHQQQKVLLQILHLLNTMFVLFLQLLFVLRVRSNINHIVDYRRWRLQSQNNTLNN